MHVGIRLFHSSLVVVVFGVSALGLDQIKLPVPHSVSLNGLEIFSFHQSLVGMALALPSFYVVGALVHKHIFGNSVIGVMFSPRLR